MLSEKFINDLLNMVKQDGVKQEMKLIVRPFINMMLKEIYPYLFASLVFVCISFLLTLSIFVLVLKKSPVIN